MSKIYLPKNHPAFQILQNEGFDIIDAAEKLETGKRPLRIGIINLMPTPVDPVADFGRLLAQNPDQDIEIFDFSPTPENITDKYYKIIDRIKLEPLRDIGDYDLDGAILSGFGKEDKRFEELRFWPELTKALDTLKANKTPIYASCWGAHAALYHHHKVEKTWDITKKVLGVFVQQILEPAHALMAGIDPEIGFPMPVSRTGKCNEAQILANSSLTVIATNETTGASIVTDDHITYVTGHPEYNKLSLVLEYARDLARKALHLCVPENVFADNDPDAEVLPAQWLDPAKVLINNWVQIVNENALKPKPQARAAVGRLTQPNASL